MVLSKEFYSCTTVQLAKRLIGTFLVHRSPQGRLVGRIVETEAYLFRNDPACHAHKGETKRNAAMFGPAGRSYVYLIYGMYNCFNVVSGKLNEGEAVLIRALEPLAGIEDMRKHRNSTTTKELCSGPGKLTQAMAITREHNNLCLQSSALQIHSRDSYTSLYRGSRHISIDTTTRIGINQGKELPLRFLLRDNRFISKKA